MSLRLSMVSNTKLIGYLNFNYILYNNMNKHKIQIIWPNGSVTEYESVVNCANTLNTTTQSINNYLKSGNGPLATKFVG